MRRLSLALLVLLAYLNAAPAAAQAAGDNQPGVRTDTPSGLPVPRFVSLKNARTYCRLGPSFNHPIAFTYLREGLPVQVVAETTDHWRKIRDRDGGECWAHRTTLEAVNHAIVSEDVTVFARPDPASPVRARLSAGVIAKLERAAKGGWRMISVGRYRGWVRQDQLWGAE